MTETDTRETSRQIGDISVLRERASVKLELDWEGGDSDTAYLPPESAVKVATWLQQAATDCKQYEREADHGYHEDEQ